MESKIYTFKTIKDITEAITKDNIDNFLVDFKEWLSVAIEFNKIKEFKGLVKLDTSQFKWTDDNKHDKVIHIHTKDNSVAVDINLKEKK